MIIRALHLCLPNEDNLGDDLAHAVIGPLFQQRGAVIELKKIDLADLRLKRRFLDDDVDRINSQFDIVLIGAGGLLGRNFTDGIFQHLESWERLTTPHCFVGVGVIANAGMPVYYTTAPEASHLAHALKTAQLVAVRDLQSWLLAARLMGRSSNRLFLTGCPTIRFTRVNRISAKSHALALNIPLRHGVCSTYENQLVAVAESLGPNRQKVRWVCHSNAEEVDAKRIVKNLNLGFEILRPRTAEEAGEAYAACQMALVTKAHAGIFCLANSVPFGIIAYDVKCWNLMSMIVDEPYKFCIPIERLVEVDVGSTIKRLLGNLQKESRVFTAASSLLVSYLDSQLNQFVDKAISLAVKA